jgi:Tfp pilus assembly protein PilF
VYRKAGQKDLAITNYEKALQLDPKNKIAPEALKKLKENK